MARTAGETIHTTANHPWLTADRGWVQAGQLQPGEPVVTLNGGSSGAVAWVHVVPGQADMYNLTVANDHTYAVGAGQWVVHNIGEGCINSPGQVHLDNGVPRGVDTAGFTGTQTMNGGVRDPREFWRAYLQTYPQHLSATNTAGILASRFHAPTVDEVWTIFYPEHAPYLGDTLIHHHLDYGPFAIALPESLHRPQPWWGFWHSDHQGPDWEAQWNAWWAANAGH